MSVYGKLVNDTFDILDIDESDTSLVRNPDMIRFTYKHDGKLIQYVKTVDTPVISRFFIGVKARCISEHIRSQK